MLPTNKHPLGLLVLTFRPAFIDIVYFLSLQCSYSPESCAVKVDHHPLGGVEDKRVGKFNSLQRPAELRAEVS